MKKMEDRIAMLEQQLRKLKVRHQEAETRRKREEALQDKKDEERRKVLVGTIVIEKVGRGEIEEIQFREWLDATLTRPEDRALFNLRNPPQPF